MDKIEICNRPNPGHPMPRSLVGTNARGKGRNYVTIAWFSMVHPKPPYVLVTMNKAHHTNQGIKENGTFSVNIPSVDLVEKTDYCGLVSSTPRPCSAQGVPLEQRQSIPTSSGKHPWSTIALPCDTCASDRAS